MFRSIVSRLDRPWPLAVAAIGASLAPAAIEVAAGRAHWGGLLWMVGCQAFVLRQLGRYRRVGREKDRTMLENSMRRYADSFSLRNREALAVAGGEAVVFIGDSLISRWKVETEFPALPAVNRGIGGNTTLDVDARLDVDALRLRPKIAIVAAGTNDLLFGTGPGRRGSPQEEGEAIAARLGAIAERLQAGGARAVVASIPPLISGGERPPAAVANRAIRRRCDALGVAVLDLFSLLGEKKDPLVYDPTLTDDGIHPNDAGYQVMTGALATLLLHPPTRPR